PGLLEEGSGGSRGFVPGTRHGRIDRAMAQRGARSIPILTAVHGTRQGPPRPGDAHTEAPPARRRGWVIALRRSVAPRRVGHRAAAGPAVVPVLKWTPSKMFRPSRPCRHQDAVRRVAAAPDTRAR